MRSHLKYLSYVLRHKYFVLRAGLLTGAPLWRLIIHDWSKFLPSEWTAYVNSFYGGWKYDERPEWVKRDFDAAWLHHQHNNPHHWQHWILREDMGDIKVLEMPIHFVQEMVADWMGAGRTITGQWDVWDWYDKNESLIRLHPTTRGVVEIILNQAWQKSGALRSQRVTT